MRVSCDPGNNTSYSAVKVLDFLDADSSDSGSSGEEKDDIYG